MPHENSVWQPAGLTSSVSTGQRPGNVGRHLTLAVCWLSGNITECAGKTLMWKERDKELLHTRRTGVQ